MKRRVRAQPSPGHAFLLECERRAQAAGDARRLAQVRSWLSMLRPDNDPDIADLFATYAREEGC